MMTKGQVAVSDSKQANELKKKMISKMKTAAMGVLKDVINDRRERERLATWCACAGGEDGIQTAIEYGWITLKDGKLCEGGTTK